MPSIDRNSSVPYYQQIFNQIARGIESGLHPTGEKLPSIRECARELDVSTTTIEQAYRKLVAEGYVEARRGSGFVICMSKTVPAAPLAQPSDVFVQAREALVQREAVKDAPPAPAYDFAYDAVDASTFPITIWARICREVFFSKGVEAACLYNDCQGLRDLRVEIAHYLCGEYGLNCTPEQVLVMPTTRDLVSEIVSLFDSADSFVAMENPGYDEVRKRLIERGYQLLDVPAYPQIPFDEKRRLLEGANILFATPACQFPTNTAMPLEERLALVGWAHDNDAYIIDDEYGWEFQSGVARTPPLGALDRTGRVITIGTFSNSFTPAVCLSYAVLPPQLMLKWQDARRGSHPQVPWQTQSAMAVFIREGHWRSHVRRVRTSSLHKRQLVMQAIARYMGDAVEVVEGSSSLFVLVRARDNRNEAELIEAAARSGVKVYPTSRYWHGAVPDNWRYVQVGFAGINSKSIEDGIKALATAWGMCSR